MKIEDLFNKTISSASLDTIGEEAESYRYARAWRKDKDRFVPAVDYSKIENFAKFGSAEQYYEDAIRRIFATYPYDGSLFERLEWRLSGSYFDNHIFDNEYPRTTGYVIFSAHDTDGTGWSTQADAYSGYGAPATASYEYISIKGGPGTSDRVIGKDIQDASGDYKDGYANVFDVGKGRDSNLRIDGITGNTVEFWMKKSEFVTSLTNKEVIFDTALTTNGGASAEDYGRLTIEMSAGLGYNDSPFYVTYMSGTARGAGFVTASIGKNITTSTIADGDWHHYAFTFKNVDSNLESKLYIDKKCNHTITGSALNLHKGASSTTVNYISGSITGTIGALCAHKVDSTRQETGNAAGLGWGKLSASLDDFRFWKTKRSSKDIGLNYFRDVGGGANTDLANTDLGVYYKFNEGITGTSSVDDTILDYSGRICNGAYSGYRSVSRSTGSAINESSASVAEFKDPILYPFHDRVASYRTAKKNIGFEYDVRNNSALFTSLPAWIIEEDEAYGDLNVKKLTQIMSSYFDSLWLQIDSINKIKDETYFSSSFKPMPQAKRLLQERGLVTPDLFADAQIIENMLHQDHRDIYTDKIHNLKNLIYQNIFNNLNYIYKSKGTEKSFRNLIRCFGVDDELIKFNIYAKNTTYDLKSNYRDTVVRKNYIDFYTSDTHESTIYQMTASNNLNSTSFLSGAADSGSAITFETEVIFPRLHLPNSKNWIPNNFFTSSIFGIHTPNTMVGDEGDTSWNDPDYANFQVYAVRRTRADDIIRGKGYTKHDVRFMLTSSQDSLAIELTSSTFRKVYDNNKWNFAVRVLPISHPQSYRLGGTYFGHQDYKVEFYGVNINKDIIENSFHVTGTINYVRGMSFLTSSKRLYVGAERTNFTGALYKSADARISSTRIWADYLSNGAINAHARDPSNYGTLNAYWHAFPGQSHIKNSYIPQMETLALHWDFNQITSSDGDGMFQVVDVSSGSTALLDRYGGYSHMVHKQHTGTGYKFPTAIEATRRNQGSTVAVKEHVQGSKQSLPENLHTSDTIKIIENETEDDTVFTRESRPQSLFFAFEKSMYQVISEEIINFFATIVDFNNLIGEPVNRYRQEYKDLSKLRQLFFERIGNTPNLVKFIDYYKWIDSALGIFLEQLVPASAEYGQGIRNMVESHILERSKYFNKFPTLEMKQDDPEAHLFGINELLYDWKHGHYGDSTDQTKQCLWWKDRSEKFNQFSSGDSNVDKNKQAIQEQYVSKNVSGSTYAIRSFSRPYKFTIEKGKVIHGGINFSYNKKLDYINTLMRKVDSTYENSLAFGRSDLLSSSADLCTDNAALDTKNEFTFKTTTGSIDIKGELIAPFNILDQDEVTRTTKSPDHPPPNSRIVNFHHDTYGDDKETPMQSPFTEKFVGGRQHRHVWNFASLIQTGSHPDVPLSMSANENITTRPEGWRIGQNTSQYKLINPTYNHNSVYNPDLPRAVFYRDETAKRPINIRNIQQTTGSNTTGFFTYLGNYTHDYEIVQTVGRSMNNRALIDQAIHWEIFTKTGSIAGLFEYKIPNRSITGSNKSVFVNRFSAPGGPETMGEGFLDVEAGEYSVYNALPWRNLSVRKPLQEWQTNHTKPGGYYSDAQYSSSWAQDGRRTNPGFSTGPGTYSGMSGTMLAETYEGTASYHKVNRNARKVLKFDNYWDNSPVVTASVYDNWYVQHMIPQSDIQYSWITASATNVIFGYEQPDHSLGSQASTDIVFLSSSEFTAVKLHATNDPFRWGRDIAAPIHEFATSHTDFVGLNHHILEALSGSDNILGYPLRSTGDVEEYPYGTPYLNTDAATDAQYANRAFLMKFGGSMTLGAGGRPDDNSSATWFNAIMLNRGGVYGWPTWKQIRGYQHPLVRYWRKTNDYNFPIYRTTIRKGVQLFDPFGAAAFPSIELVSVDSFDHYTEPPISSKSKPIKHVFRNDKSKKTLTLNHTYGNNLTYFANIKLNNNFDTFSKEAHQKQFYNNLKTIYIDNNVEVISDLTFKKLVYSETIFPKEKYTFLNKIRGRTRYTEDTESQAGAEFDWPESVRVENNINRRTFAINGEKETYRPIRTFWRDDLEDRIKPKYFARNSLDFLQHQPEGNDWYDAASDPAGRGRDAFITASLARSVWPLDCNYPGNFIWGAPGSYSTSWRWSMNLPTTSSVTGAPEFGHNGELSVYNDWQVLVSSVSAGSAAHLAFSASMCYEYPYAVRVSSSAKLPDRWHPWWATYRAATQSGRKPWYDSYDKYAEDIRVMGQDYSVIPEFRISEHIDKYLSNSNEFQMQNDEFLTLEGGGVFSGSTPFIVDDFYETYSHTEFMKHFETIKKDHKGLAAPTQFKLACKGIKKLLPYNGFYPVLRSVQLGAMLSQSFGPNLQAGSTINYLDDFRPERLQAFMDLFYAPGIMYNTIKSGIAVDYPVLTGSGVNISINTSFWNESNEYALRMPFEAIIEPERFLPVSSSLSDSDEALHLGRINGNLTIGQAYAKGYAQALSHFAWSGESSIKYSLAAHNFFGEIPRFFLKDQKLTTFVSLPENQANLSFVSGSTYYMDVVLYKTKNLIMYEGPPKFRSLHHSGDPGSPTGTDNTVTERAYSAGFRGVPYGFPSKVRDIYPILSPDPEPAYGSGDPTPQYVSGNASDPAFAPFTPPYFYGRAIGRMQFKPHDSREMQFGSADKFNLEDVISYCEENMDYFNNNDGLNAWLLQDKYTHRGIGTSANPTGSIALGNQMQISASVNLFGRTKMKASEYDVITGKKIKSMDNPDSSFDVWSISTKFETPILNFTGAINTTDIPHFNDGDVNSEVSTAQVPATSFGMWKDYGSIPKTNEGIFLQLKESFRRDQYGRHTGSLMQKLFPGQNKKERLGELADYKDISEAIVAMPFTEGPNGEREFISILKKDYLQPGGFDSKTMMKFLRKIVNDDYSPNTLSIDEAKATKKLYGQSVFDMVKKMDKYIVPPQFDWINNNSVEPYAMYIFEFTHRLSKQDLSYIWQNLMPDAAMQAVKIPGKDKFAGTRDTIEAPEVSHPIHFGDVFFGAPKAPRELLTGEELNSELSWMVFKIKRKAETNYYNVTADTTDDSKFFDKLGPGGGNIKYSYNWPYDYFSLVELAKIDAEVEFSQPFDNPELEGQVEEILKTAEEMKKIAQKKTGDSEDGGVTLEELLAIAAQSSTLFFEGAEAMANIPLGAQAAEDGHDQATPTTQPVVTVADLDASAAAGTTTAAMSTATTETAGEVTHLQAGGKDLSTMKAGKAGKGGTQGKDGSGY